MSCDCSDDGSLNIVKKLKIYEEESGVDNNEIDSAAVAPVDDARNVSIWTKQTMVHQQALSSSTSITARNFLSI